MAKLSKRVRANLEMVTSATEELSVSDAVTLLKKTQSAKFDETVEMALRLGIDMKKSDQIVRGAVSLPHGIGKEVRVIAFAKGDKADEARAAGALEVGEDELAKKIQGGWMDFEIVIASPDMMRVVGKLGRVLGPQGKMPSPKAGTVTPDVASAVREFKAGKVTVRADKDGNVHAPIGKKSFDADKLADNANALVNYVRSIRPAAAKGHYILSAHVSSTMGPGIALAGL